MDERDVCMSYFILSSVAYMHYINTENDETFFVKQDENDKKILTVDSSGNLEINNIRMGSFRFTPPDYRVWMFTFNNGEVITSSHIDLIKFEVDVFKILIERGLILLATSNPEIFRVYCHVLVDFIGSSDSTFTHYNNFNKHNVIKYCKIINDLDLPKGSVGIYREAVNNTDVIQNGFYSLFLKKELIPENLLQELFTRIEEIN